MWQIKRMQPSTVKLLDIVALLEERPKDGMASGQVGTIVELHSPEAFDVEFLDSSGRTIGLVTLKRSEVLLLRHEPATTAA